MNEILNIFFLLSIFSLNIIFVPFLNTLYNKKKVIKIDIENFKISLIFFLFFLLLSLILKLSTNIIGNSIIIFSFLSILLLIFLRPKIQNILLLLVLLILNLYGSITIIADLQIGHDAQKFYIPRAIHLYFFSFNNDIESARPVPLFGPYMWASFRHVSLISNEVFGRLINLFIFSTTFLILVNKLIIKQSYKIAILAILFFLTFDNYHFDGKLDIIVFCLNILIGITFYEIFFEQKNLTSNLIQLLILMFLLLWTKNECIAYFLSYLILIIFYSNYKFKQKLYFIIFSVLIYFFRLIYFYKSGLSLNPDHETLEIKYILSLGFHDLIIKSLMTIKWYFLYLFKNPHFLAITPLIFYSIFKLKNKLKYFLLTFILLNFITIFAVYILSKFPMPFHLIASLDRVIFQYSGFYTIFILIFFNNFNKYFK